MLLPGGAPLGGGYTDQLRTTAGAPEAPSPWQEERLSNRWGQEGGFGGGIVHRGRGGGTRDTSEQVESRRFTLSLYPQGWRERSKEAGRRRDNNEKERKRVKMQLGWEN